jgi:Flp pilus assembly protein TadD
VPKTPQVPKAKQPALDLSVLFKQTAELLSQNKLDEVFTLYQRALETDQTNARIHNDLGYIYLEKNHLAEAEKHLTMALEINPRCSECTNNLGLLQTRQNKTREAEQSFIKAIIFNEEFPEPYFNLGVLYEKNGDRGNALVSYQDFLKHSPDKNSILYVKVENRILTLTGK